FRIGFTYRWEPAIAVPVSVVVLSQDSPEVQPNLGYRMGQMIWRLLFDRNNSLPHLWSLQCPATAIGLAARVAPLRVGSLISAYRNYCLLALLVGWAKCSQ